MSKTLCHSFLESKSKRSTRVALKYKKNRTWKSLNFSEYYSMASEVGGALKALGLQKGDPVALMANTRYEWVVADQGILGIGGITVPIYTSNLAEDVEFILNNSEAKVLIIETKEHIKLWNQIKDRCPGVARVIIINSVSESHDLMDWRDFLDRGAQYNEDHENHFEDSCKDTEVDQVASILYTSGTTGRPKGVVISHRQIMSELIDVFSIITVDERDSSLTFLPYAHILGRVESWGNIYAGYTMCFAESIEKIRVNLAEVSPTFLIAVPRIFEKIYNGILTQVESSPLKNKIFGWASQVGGSVSEKRREKKGVSLPLLGQYLLAQKLVFSKFKEKLGGRLRFAVSGGAPLSKEIGEFFHGAGLLILEGYGLTETTAGVTFNTPLHYKFGTVGRALADVELKIAEDGEILVKSDKVMVEYYKNPEATEAVLNEGYFATGDIGEIDDEGFLKITDRKKDLIKTAGGKYVAPQRLENLIKLNKYVSNVLIHGDQKKYIVALVTLDPDALIQFADENMISYSDKASLSQHSAVKEAVRQAIAEANSQLASFESVKNFAVLDHDFTIESGELTPSLKVKRKVCDEKYQKIIDSLYGADRGVI